MEGVENRVQIKKAAQNERPFITFKKELLFYYFQGFGMTFNAYFH